MHAGKRKTPSRVGKKKDKTLHPSNTKKPKKVTTKVTKKPKKPKMPKMPKKVNVMLAELLERDDLWMLSQHHVSLLCKDNGLSFAEIKKVLAELSFVDPSMVKCRYCGQSLKEQRASVCVDCPGSKNGCDFVLNPNVTVRCGGFKCDTIVKEEDATFVDGVNYCSMCFANVIVRCGGFKCDTILKEEDAEFVDGVNYCSMCFANEISK